jgi:ATP-dependent helicase/nuclease subunit B
MNVTFGVHADGGTWPEHGGGGSASFGAPVVGPAGLVALLEAELGLAGPPSSVLDRVVAWQAKLEAADGRGRFWTRSLAADAWATARLLLGWRDDLMMAGWRPDPGGSERRLADLAAAEAAGGPLPRGLADRLLAVEHRLAAGARPGHRTLRTIDRIDDLPAPWRRLLRRLADAGVEVTEGPPTPAADPATSLGHLQRWLADGGDVPTAATADATVLWARAGSTPHAAEVLGQWLATVPSDASVVLIAQGGDSHALDLALRAGGLPRFGASATSAYRGSLQVLLLAFQLAWRPVDVRALLELLTLPNSPIPGRVGARLSRVLESTPGIGGAPWREAWAAIEAAESGYAADEADPQAAVRERLARWRAWVEPAQVDPAEGIALPDAAAVCDRVASWATRRAAGSSDPLYRSTARLAMEVRAAFLRLGRERLPKAWVDRVVDQALADGDRDPQARAEAAPRRQVVAHPGAIWGPADVVVWWDFRQGGDQPPRSPWSGAERAALSAGGADLDAPAVAARAASAAWERAVTHARRQLLFVSTGLDADADEARHPLAHRLAPALDRLGRVERLEGALERPAFELGGALLERLAVAPRPLPAAALRWPTPRGYAERVAERSESATSLEALLACPMQWALGHVARLRAGRVRSIPEPEQLFGNLAHALAADVFAPGDPPTPEEAAARVEADFERYVDELAVPLRYDEHAVEFVQARRLLPLAIGAVAGTLRRNRLRVVATEHRFEAAPPGGPPLRGFVDLLAEDDAGRVVVDLKWAFTPRYRTEELEEGLAVQLAVYGAAMAAEGAAPPPPVAAVASAPRAGYYLLKQRRFLTTPDSGLAGTVVRDAPDLAATWDAVVEGWAGWRRSIDAGTLRARGVALSEGVPEDVVCLAREPRCDRCAYAALCRTKGAHDGA